MRWDEVIEQGANESTDLKHLEVEEPGSSKLHRIEESHLTENRTMLTVNQNRVDTPK